MSARIIQFPGQRALRPSVGATFIGRSLSETQEQARRIVAQVEREIASQAAAMVAGQEQRLQMRLKFTTPPPIVVEMETPATVARRILHAIFPFARSA